MDSERIFNFRFIVPPSLTIFLVLLFEPHSFIEFFNLLAGVSWLVEGVIGATVILSLGFIISTITYLFVSTDMMIIEPKCSEHYEDIFGMKEVGYKKTVSLELGSWLVLDKIDRDANRNSHVINQVHKRWNMAMSNFNCITAIIFSQALILILLFIKVYSGQNIYYVISYTFAILVLLLVFLINGKDAHRSVLTMDYLLAQYKNPKSKPKG